jgi:hypothetical protein
VLIKRCGNCNEVFSASPVGRAATLCRDCAAVCEDSYLKILKFLREHEDLNITNVENISEGTQIPIIFIQTLYKEGRFEGKGPPPAKQACKRCSIQLKEDEKDMCTTCSRSLSQEIHEERTALGVQPEPVNYYTPPGPSKKPSRRDGKENRYGLGR